MPGSRFWIEPDRRHLLRGGNVEPGLEIGNIGQAKCLHDIFRRSSEGESTTHGTGLSLTFAVPSYNGPILPEPFRHRASFESDLHLRSPLEWTNLPLKLPIR